jgi:polyisoprenoid-binding protein YceI
VTLNVELIGAGKGFMGHPRLGAEATGNLKTADFGLPAILGPTVELVIDAEFARTN